MKVFVVIPAFNEAKMIQEVILQVKPFADEVVVIDDGSKDQTAALAKKALAEVLVHKLNRGQGAALQTGITYALKKGAEIIVTFDADGQHDPGDIKKLATVIGNNQADVCLGSRFIKSENRIPFSKQLLLKSATFFTQLYTGLKITDTHNGLRAFSAHAASLIYITQDGMAHASEILEQISRYNLKYQEIPVTIKYTEYSQGKGQKLSGAFQILFDLFLSRITR